MDDDEFFFITVCAFALVVFGGIFLISRTDDRQRRIDACEARGGTPVLRADALAYTTNNPNRIVCIEGTRHQESHAGR